MDSTGFKLPRESPDAAFAKERFPRQVFASTPQRHKTHTLAHAQRPAVINDTTAGRPLAHARTAQPRATPRLKTPRAPGTVRPPRPVCQPRQSVNVLRRRALGCYDQEQTRFARGCTLLFVLFDSGRILMSLKQSLIHAFAGYL